MNEGRVRGGVASPAGLSSNWTMDQKSFIYIPETNTSESSLRMKVLSLPESPRHRATRRVSKPVMEKRRRERINHSLETLRLLMLENTHDEKLKNPKVEKAEILESVVQFLKTDMDQVLSRERRPTRAHQQSYQAGMRSCLLRVRHFISTKTQVEPGHTDDDDREAGFPSSPSSPGLLLRPHAGDAARSPRHHPHLTPVKRQHCDPSTLLSPAARTHTSEPVWRPWPQ